MVMDAALSGLGGKWWIGLNTEFLAGNYEGMESNSPFIPQGVVIYLFLIETSPLRERNKAA